MTTKQEQKQAALKAKADLYRPRWTYKPGDQVRQVKDTLDSGAYYRAPFMRMGAVYTVERVFNYSLELSHADAKYPNSIGYEEDDRQCVRPAVLSRQDVFDIAAWHMVFVLAGKPAVDGLSCRYESQKGTQCAVGCLVPDRETRQRMRGTVRVNAYGLYPILEAWGVPVSLEPTKQLLGELQAIHDRVDMSKPLTPGRQLHIWKRSLRRLAERSNLRVPEYLQAK